MKNKILVRYSRETKEKIVNAIVSGELWLEEAMVKYNVHDRRTVIDWLRKYQREQKKGVVLSPIDFNAYQGNNLMM